ncbi:MAG: CPBP family intramembrane glutamic endopeptidase [candidate division WOR-3 bacterium]
MKFLLFFFILFSPLIRWLIFNLKVNFVIKHIIWTCFKWLLTIFIILGYKLPFDISFESFIYGIFIFLGSVLYFFFSSFLFKFKIFDGLKEIYNLPLIFRILGGISAGITEEIIYRGFLVLFINEFLNNLFLSCFFSLLIFGIFHIPLWGFIASTQISIWSIILYSYFLIKGEIFALIIAHSLNDIFFFLKTPLTNKFLIKQR